MQERHIRQARKTDAEFLGSCTSAAYSKYVERLGRLPEPMIVNYAKILDESQVWILECHGKRAGLLVLQPDGNQLFIFSIAIAPEFQDSGHGKFLMSFAEEEASRQERSHVSLYTNELMHENISFYALLGYEETCRQEYQGGYLVHMRKEVGANF